MVAMPVRSNLVDSVVTPYQRSSIPPPMKCLYGSRWTRRIKDADLIFASKQVRLDTITQHTNTYIRFHFQYVIND